MKPVMLGGPLSLEDLEDVAVRRRPVQFAADVRAKVDASRKAIDKIALAGDDAPRVYGVNTGFGALSETRISAADIRALQRNLVRSHSTGVGTELSIAETRGMMLLRAQVIALGHSGARAALVDLLVDMLNRGVHPRVPSQGSVGASGDLAPLAHLALTMIGEGEASFDPPHGSGNEKDAKYTRKFADSADILREAKLEAVTLEAKEGLALINGTQMMASVGALALAEAERLATIADVAGAVSLEALKGSKRPFDERLQAARPHPGQAKVAGNLRAMLAESEIMESHKHCGKVQD
ncbi:MAG: aromatic amino acid lyase, partial [Polyangiaceae bacterium]